MQLVTPIRFFFVFCLFVLFCFVFSRTLRDFRMGGGPWSHALRQQGRRKWSLSSDKPTAYAVIRADQTASLFVPWTPLQLPINCAHAAHRCPLARRFQAEG